MPLYNGAATIRECLAALNAGTTVPLEVIVVDDASHDGGAVRAAAAGARLVVLPYNVGPGPARNAGAAVARGEVLFFVDADVAPAPDAVARVTARLAARPELAAVFGSYDDRPAAPGVVSQYRNLLHHFVHQHGAEEAFTFWAGCGAIRRAVFAAHGGFDEGAYARGIEDVELGYRLRGAGERILLDKGLQGTHLKRWTVASIVRADVWLRAVPWVRLLRAWPRAEARDLNLAPGQRTSVAATGVAGLALALACVWPAALGIAAAALAVIAVANRDFYGFLARVRGPGFAVRAFPLHVLYFACCGFGVLYVVLFPGPRLGRAA